ncbi:MAG: GNAT family N-acetyltransferase [Candidatus Marinimicrobia bacterium]|nr:GNAT family N-acetyltransferase [Candidatus Neomarinimicrobiota bacterium]MCF7828858.1 GNAT family N-acetyltransferase [Candidatus Neomarinimicrobiota bacterium]MCF7880775.1 GNAT family N-acetyltransferase [Candidatus Neomarinimicrobiota bacterium]
MAIEFLPADELSNEEWDEFVWSANNGTIFHTRQFLSYHPKDRFEDQSYVVMKKEQPYALLPAVKVEYDEMTTLFSHRGASYGGFVYQEDISIRDAYNMVEGLLREAGDSDIEQIVMTHPPYIYNRRITNYLDFALYKHGFDYLKREISSMLTLESSIEGNLGKFRSSARRNYRKALKEGVVVRRTDDYADFYAILKKNLKIRHDVQPTHTLEELEHLANLFPDRINLFGAYLDDRMIAGVVNFICNRDVVLAFYISHDEEYQEYRAVNLLFYEIIRWAIDQHFRYLDFGIFTVNEDPNFGLGRFKESFGASGVFRDTFVKTVL